MNRAIQFAKLSLLLCAAFAMIAFTLAALQARDLVIHFEDGWDTFVQHGVAIEQDVDDTVNDAHTAVRLTPKLINDARLSFDNLNSAALDERFYFEHQIPATMDGVNAVIRQSGDTLTAYQRTADSLSSAANGLLPVEANAAKTLGDADGVIASPKIGSILTNVDDAAAATASTAKHGDAVMGDVQIEADKIARPPKKKLGFWGSIYAGAQVVHKLSPSLF